MALIIFLEYIISMAINLLIININNFYEEQTFKENNIKLHSADY